MYAVLGYICYSWVGCGFDKSFAELREYSTRPPPQTLIHTFIRYHAQIISRMTLFKIGQTVRYARTGTVGKIVSIPRDGDADYAELDTTGLLYRTDQLTEIAETAHKAKTERNVRKETAEEAAREQAIRESAWLAVDNSCEGGG